jgi:hypothetical protein
MTIALPRLSVATIIVTTACCPLVRGDAPIVNDAPRPHLAISEAKAPLPLVTAQSADPAWAQVAATAIDTPSLNSKLAPTRVIPKTEVRALWSPDGLYFRFTCAEDHAPYVVPPAAGGSLSNGDVVEIFLDPAGDCRQWFELQFNAAGARFIQISVCTSDPKWDASLRLTGDSVNRNSWSFQDPSLQSVRSATAPWRKDGRTIGWIVDVALPAVPVLKRTGLRKFEPMTLRGDLLRYQWSVIPGTDKRDLLSLNWSPVVFGAPHRSPAAFGFFDLSPSQP